MTERSGQSNRPNEPSDASEQPTRSQSDPLDPDYGDSAAPRSGDDPKRRDPPEPASREVPERRDQPSPEGRDHPDRPPERDRSGRTPPPERREEAGTRSKIGAIAKRTVVTLIVISVMGVTVAGLGFLVHRGSIAPEPFLLLVGILAGFLLGRADAGL